MYTYGNEGRSDQLTNFNGEAITYDEKGCPVTYRGNACTYTRGTLLASYGNNTFDYDADGIRTKKNSTTFTYVDDKLIRQIGGGATIDFIYGASGVVGFKYNNNIYIYRRNLMGDVTHIYDTAGVLKAKYIYDAWGNHIIVTDVDGIGTLNPIRYRGYYYDTETGLYYLKARYYDPEAGRFISQDSIDFIVPNHLTGLNLYAYCNNNPVMHSDPSGCWAGIDDLIAFAGGALVGVVGQFISDLTTSLYEGEWTFSNWQTYTGAAIGGAAGGMTLLYIGNPIAVGTVSGGVTTLFSLGLEKLTIDNYDKSWGEIGANVLFDAGVGGALSLLPGVEKITKGRNSWSAVYKSGLTKLGNHTARKMSLKVFAKGFGANSVSSLAMDAYYGLKQFSYNRIKALIL